MIKKIFITGATGYIGKFLVEFLSKKGYVIYINIRKGKKSPFSKKINTYTIGEQNIEEDIIFFKKNNFDTVIHLATLYVKHHNPIQINDMVSSNILFANHVLECAVQAKVPFFINTGSFFQNKDKMNFSPVNLYSSMKQSFEDIAKYYYESENIKFYTIKLSDTYGPDDRRPKLINLLLDSIKQDKFLNMHGNPNQLINLIHVDDVVNAFYSLIKKLDKIELKNGMIFSLKSEDPVNLRNLINLIEKIAGSKLKIKWGNNNEILISEPPEIFNIPNWKPKISLKEGIRRLLNI